MNILSTAFLPERTSLYILYQADRSNETFDIFIPQNGLLRLLKQAGYIHAYTASRHVIEVMRYSSGNTLFSVTSVALKMTLNDFMDFNLDKGFALSLLELYTRNRELKYEHKKVNFTISIKGKIRKIYKQICYAYAGRNY
jgi:hypothetical protein